ncbi:hypothetical protein GETHLI_00760 [Geothrix limicola]|uniref:Type II secretion system protein GspG C-terminal domain-containing protein n=2 Tax=Geothrix limicola TaxID=2927978 RepID=A0ABQ5Q9S3_9BACT|nr:hypothetical protein GETHLI_00760 [Geothrix limicola]
MPMNACFSGHSWHTETLGCDPSGPSYRTPPMTSNPNQASRKSRGFSLLELLVAMMIISVLATLGFRQFKKQSAQARHIKAVNEITIVGEGLDQYYLKHGHFPDFGSFDAMVDSNSPLAKESLIKLGMSAVDPFGQPYEGKSNKATYELKCLGDPNDQEEHGLIVRTPGQMTTGTPANSSEAAPKGEAPDAGAKK